MPLGEVPITSYFTRVPQKRKHNSVSAPTKAAKRKRVDSDEQIKAPKKQVSLAFPKAARNASRVASASLRHSDSNVDLESRVLRSETFLPATPNTRHRPSLSPLPDAPALPMASEESPLLPPSSSISHSSPLVTPPRPRRKSDAANGKAVAFASSPLLSFRNANAPTDDDLPPSSVSQYWPPIRPRRPSNATTMALWSLHPSRQWLLPLHLNATPNVPAYVVDDEVPSSQSQFEVELKPRNGFPFPTRRASGSSLVQSAPRRPSSDLAVDVADMFEEGSVDLAKVNLKDQDDSATESDDDIPVIPPRPSAPLPPPPASQHDGYSIPPGGFSSCVDESIPDEGSSAGSSLPEAVKNFYNMLDGGDGSYPASFPESLRGHWICGTPDGTPEE
ncbi:hypothetical protein B0H16DRAFT_1498772 [Mycena metata]|uniref:Uncharacterized protein n=1 Tax=Mycena metata TaxID=1033252 RepID=A0AAD7NZ09_9AGAR|nr:hypothetical protein B0H16DRAFT_1498772 [Mycena metata]